MNLIVGLGNPGRVYTNNRHNIGFICLNYLARTHGIRFDKKQSQARIGTGEIAGTKVILARPQTYMNSSGEAVSSLVKRHIIDIINLFVVHDDLDLPLGKIRIRRGGGSGGHKGIESIITELGNPDFIRVRIGIGRLSTANSTEITEADIINYVLSDFNPDEKQVIAETIPRVSEALLCLLTEDMVTAMNKYN